MHKVSEIGPQAVLAHKFGRAFYYMLKNGTVFDEEKFLNG